MGRSRVVEPDVGGIIGRVPARSKRRRAVVDAVRHRARAGRHEKCNFTLRGCVRPKAWPQDSAGGTAMASQHVATYLNDHLAGSVVALELLEHLQKAHARTPVEGFAAALWADIKSDQEELKGLIAKLDAGTSVMRRAAAWLSEKATELKLKADDPGDGALRLLESLEAVSLGIEGKRNLWLALEAASAANPALRGVDYQRLRQRAEDQRSRAESARLDAAREALR
jgi:hypothetical protein